MAAQPSTELEPERRRGLDSALDAATALIDAQREHSRTVRDQLKMQEKLCSERHRLSMAQFPNWLRWAVAFLLMSWLISGALFAVWVHRVDSRVDAFNDMMLAIQISDQREEEQSP